MRIKNAALRHNQLVHILALPFLPLAFPLNFFFLFSLSHYFLIFTLRMRFSQPIVVFARVSNNLMTSCGEHQSVGGAPTDVDF